MGFIIDPYKFGAGGGFVPSDIAGLDWWLDADDVLGVDNDPVSNWPDGSGGGRDYGQSTGSAQPTLKKNIVNGHAVVRFATNDKLIPNPTSRSLGSANTIVVVCTPSSTTNSYIFGSDGGGGVPAFISGFASKAFEYYNGGSERATFATTASGFHILTVTRTDNTGNAEGYYDGTSVFSAAVDTSIDWNLGNIIEIGANGNAAGEDFFSGDIAEILHWPSVLSGGDLTSLHNYLKAKYGIA